MATIGGPEAALLFLWTGIAVDGTAAFIAPTLWIIQ
jgi:hypothetical protein